MERIGRIGRIGVELRGLVELGGLGGLGRLGVTVWEFRAQHFGYTSSREITEVKRKVWLS